MWKYLIFVAFIAMGWFAAPEVALGAPLVLLCGGIGGDSMELLRFSDLRRMKIVSNWPTLLRWIKLGRFPAGLMLGPNSRAWRLCSVRRFLDEAEERGRAAFRERAS
jgi:predicted DNA-binding transcriptional regulator AlpA